MSYVFVVDAAQRPLTPVHPGAARLLLTRGEAADSHDFGSTNAGPA